MAITKFELILFAPALYLLLLWAYRTRFGTEAFETVRYCHHKMPSSAPFLVLFAWIILQAVGFWLKDTYIETQTAHGLSETNLDNLVITASAIAGIFLVLYTIKQYFTDGFKEAGLRIRNLPKDIAAAFLYLYTLWPILTIAILCTLWIGKLIVGPEFAFEQHLQLEMLAESKEPLAIILIGLNAIVLAPVFEELLFRGLFQSLLLSRTKQPWASIAITSVIFVVIHANLEHWPTLFVLSMCLGYAYERSGSLFRSICIHALFNGISVVGTLFFSGVQNQT